MTQDFLRMQKVLRFLLSLVFPEAPLARRVRRCTGADFSSSAQMRRNDTVFTSPKTLSPFVYRDAFVRTAIHLAKYRNEKGVCRMLGETLWDIYGEDLSSYVLMHNTRWLVVPVPLAPHKRRMRGYNQSEEIARGFLHRADCERFVLAENVLHRTESRKSQTKQMTRRERAHNVAGSFFVRSDAEVRAHNIIVFDDVVTTGATLQDATRALHKAGARRILCIAVAH